MPKPADSTRIKRRGFFTIMPAYPSRTRFNNEIVAEFMMPRRRSRNAVILLDGFPTSLSKQGLMEFFMKKGYWVFYPRYRGSWESGGTFLRTSPDHDVIDIINELPNGFRDAKTGTRYCLDPVRIVLIGASFGGPAAILASRDSRVTAAIAVAPVVDWKDVNKTEAIGAHAAYVKRAFGEAYRPAVGAWRKLKSWKFYNPVAAQDGIDGRKIFIIHAKDDDVVRWRPVARFAKRVGAELALMKRGGHLSSSVVMRPCMYKKVRKFLRKKL